MFNIKYKFYMTILGFCIGMAIAFDLNNASWIIKLGNRADKKLDEMDNYVP